MRSGEGLFPDGVPVETGGLGIASFDVTLGGETFSVSDTDLPTEIFDTSGMDIDALPNAAGSYSVLTEADLKRLAYNAATPLVLFLINELGRSEHSHESECGTSQVTPVNELPLITNDWDSCERPLGLFISGNFTLEFMELEADRITMLAQGDMIIGGGIPKITLGELVWSIERVDASTDRWLISGGIEGPAGSRAFSFELIADD